MSVSLPVLLFADVGEAHRIIHAARHQLIGLINHHLAHLVGVAPSWKAVILPSVGIPEMWVKC